MKTLRTIRLRFPGEWEDAWLYRGHLMAWSVENSLQVVDTDLLTKQLRQRHGQHLAYLAEQLVLRSERKSTHDFKELAEVPGVFDALFAPLNEEIVLELDERDMREAAVDPVPGRILDTWVYGNRVFIASTDGVFEAQLSGKHLTSRSPLLTLTDSSCASITAGAGRVVAALGDAGLLSREVRFGDGEDWWRPIERKEFAAREIAPVSRRVSRSSVHLLNYGVDEVPTFIYADTHTQSGERFNERVISDYQNEQPLHQQLDCVISKTATNGPPSDSAIRVIGNANYHLVATSDGTPHVVDVLPDDKNKEASLRPASRFSKSGKLSAPGEAPLTVNSVSSGIVFEMFERVDLLTEDGFYSLADEQAVQVRTFGNSKRYTDTVALVADSHIDLVGFLLR